MKFNSDFRKEIYNRYTLIEKKMKYLKELVQNSSNEITNIDLENQENVGREITNELIDIQVKLEKELRE